MNFENGLGQLLSDELDPDVVERVSKHPTGVLILHPTMATECSIVRTELRRIQAAKRVNMKSKYKSQLEREIASAAQKR